MFHVKHSLYILFHVKQSALRRTGRGLRGAVILTQGGVSFSREQPLEQSGGKETQQQQCYTESHGPVPAGFAQMGNMLFRRGEPGRFGSLFRRQNHRADGNVGGSAGFYRIFFHFGQTSRAKNLLILAGTSAFHTSHNRHPKFHFLYFTSK